ncbi:hypothetical protein BH23ACI1_BH23ACI1_31200 [soil metagenome]
MADTLAPPHTLTERDAARYVGFTASALRLWRRENRGPAFVRAQRAVRYMQRDLDAWLESRRVVTREAR